MLELSPNTNAQIEEQVKILSKPKPNHGNSNQKEQKKNPSQNPQITKVGENETKRSQGQTLTLEITP